MINHEAVIEINDQSGEHTAAPTMFYVRTDDDIRNFPAAFHDFALENYNRKVVAIARFKDPERRFPNCGVRKIEFYLSDALTEWLSSNEARNVWDTLTLWAQIEESDG